MRQILLLALLLLAASANAAELIPANNITITGGGSTTDPTKLPLAGGTMTGPISYSTHSVVISSMGASNDGQVSLVFAAAAGSLGSSIYNLKATDNNHPILTFSNANILDLATVPRLGYEGATGEFSMGAGTAFGGVTLSANLSKLGNPGGSVDVRVTDTMTEIRGPVTLGSSATTTVAQVLSVPSGTVNIGLLTTGRALCLNASHNMSVCTSVIDSGGNCTCP